MVDVDGRGQNRDMKLADVPPHWRISAICLRCSHCGTLPVAYLVSTRQVGPRTTLADLEEGQMLRCARCDSKKVKLHIESNDDPTTPRRARRIVDGGAVVIDMPPRRNRR